MTIEATASLLLVDDDPSAILLLRRALEAYADVRFATNGRDALRLLRERTADLVLLDSEMPGGNGSELCRAVKADEVLRDIPVIFVTAHDDLSFEVSALELGAADFIAKPISPPRVQLRVKLHLMLKARLDRLQEQATTDVLTQLANRRHLDERLTQEWNRAHRTGQPLSLLLIDIDFFKGYNDAYGHIAGDQCLASIASTIAQHARRTMDLAARYGGEEFAVLLPDTPIQGARHVADQLRASVELASHPHCQSKVSSVVTVSIGIAGRGLSRPGHHRPGNVQALVEAADGALYQAKRAGRNRVESAELET